MGLIGRGERPMITILTGGISSFIVRADTSRGPVCVKRALPQLQVAAEWIAPVERNSAEVAWMKIAARVAPGFVPEILGEDSEGRAFAMPYLDPAQYAVWKEQLRDGIVTPSTAEAVAGNLGCVHAATALKDDIDKAFANDATFFAIRLEPYFGATAAVHPDCAHVLNGLIETTASTKLALVHGDVSPKNILVGPRGPVLLDAECAWYGDPAFDVAFCLNHLLLKCLWRPANTVNFLHCFDVFSATYLSAVRWESGEALEARACRLLAALLLARVDGKSPVEYLTEERQHALVRRVAKQFLHEPARKLSAMRNVWASEVEQ